MTYRVELVHSDEGYSVACPDLPGCASHGETEEEAMRNIKSAISDYLSVASEKEVRSLHEREVRFVNVPLNSETMAQLEPFEVKSAPLGLPPEWTSGKIEDLLDILEGPDRRW